MEFVALASIGLAPLHGAANAGRTSAPPAPFGDPLGLRNGMRPALAPTVGAGAAMLGAMQSAVAGADYKLSEMDLQTNLDPRTFQPVCPASDGFYRFGQTLVVTTVGPESYKEYAPLIAGGLLRVRLELCVVESFFYEAIFPFIKENGLSWVLPFHETVETFLAGVIFAVASNFILIGSTKIISVIFIYADIFFGLPLRTIGGAGWRGLEDKAIGIKAAEQPNEKKRPWWKGPKRREAPPIDEVWEANAGSTGGQVQLIAWGLIFGVGQVSKGFRKGVEAADVFVGRYLLLTTVAYVAIKFVHFKIYDPFPY